MDGADDDESSLRGNTVQMQISGLGDSFSEKKPDDCFQSSAEWHQ